MQQLLCSLLLFMVPSLVTGRAPIDDFRFPPNFRPFTFNLETTPLPQFSLTADMVKELENFLNEFAKGLPAFARSEIPSRVDFSGGYCKDLRLLRLQSPRISLRRLSPTTIHVSTSGGLAEGEGYCKYCKKVWFAKICAKARPQVRASNVRLNTQLRLIGSGGKPRLSMVGGCGLGVNVKIVKMRGKNFWGSVAGLFKGKLEEKAEEKAEGWGCKELSKALNKANDKLCQFLGC